MKKGKIISLFLVGLISLTYLMPMTVSAGESSTKRLAGTNRYETSVAISDAGWTSSNTAIIATGENFPDALCAVPFAKKFNAPILLTKKSKLPAETVSELKRLGVKKVYLIGSTGVIDQNVENTFRSMNISYERVHGSNRFKTSIEVAKEIGVEKGVVIVTAYNFPDALSIAPIAAQSGMPILLSTTDKLQKDVNEFLKNKNIPKTYIIGSEGVLSNNVLNSLPNAVRIGGANRYDTNLEILKHFESGLNFDNVFVATGLNFPDALSGAALSSKLKSPMVLTGNSLTTSLENYLKNKNINEVNLLGTSAVVSTSVENKFKDFVSSAFTIISIE